MVRYSLGSSVVPAGTACHLQIPLHSPPSTCKHTQTVCLLFYDSVFLLTDITSSGNEMGTPQSGVPIPVVGIERVDSQAALSALARACLASARLRARPCLHSMRPSSRSPSG